MSPVHVSARSLVEDARIYGPDDAAGKGTKVTFGYERLCERVSTVLAERDRLRAEVERLKTSLGWALDIIEREVRLAESLPACLRREARAALEAKP